MNDVVVKENTKIENMIYEIRGAQVILASDIATLYKSDVRSINQTVKRNIDRFPNTFCFQLTKEEYDILKSHFVISKNGRGGNRYLPYAFTEHGIIMLSGLLKSEIATQINVKVINAFVAMRHYIGNNEYRISNIETKIIDHDDRIKLLEDSFQKLSEDKKTNEIYFNGQIFDAYSKIYEIFNSAKNNLVIIDSYADNTILDIIKRLNVNVTIITKSNNLLTKQDIEKYNKQYNNLKVVYNNTFHDRYFLLDNSIVYHCGASINRIGYKTFSITLVNDSDIVELLNNKIKDIYNKWMR